MIGVKFGYWSSVHGVMISCKCGVTDIRQLHYVSAKELNVDSTGTDTRQICSFMSVMANK